MIGGRLCAGEDIDTDGVRCLAGGAQDGATPLCLACYNGHEEVVKLLLGDDRVDVNQATQVRVGGEGGGVWRERAGRVEGCGSERSMSHGGGRQELTSAGRRLLGRELYIPA